MPGLLHLSPSSETVTTLRTRFGVVLLPVDVARRAVLPAVQRFPVGLRQVTVIRFAHVPLFVIDALLLAFQPSRFSRRKLTAANTLPDPLLLIHFPLMDRRLLCGSRITAALRESTRRAQNQQRRAADQCSSYAHGVFLSDCPAEFLPGTGASIQ